MVRRRLHQEMQELRGNIRVIARVRPLLPSDPAPANIVFGNEKKKTTQKSWFLFGFFFF